MQEFMHLPPTKFQCKCEQYWNDDLDKPYDAGRGFTVVNKKCRTFADYEVRELTIMNVGQFELKLYTVSRYMTMIFYMHAHIPNINMGLTSTSKGMTYWSFIIYNK